jgi:hypothetical protein
MTQRDKNYISMGKMPNSSGGKGVNDKACWAIRKAKVGHILPGVPRLATPALNITKPTIQIGF